MATPVIMPKLEMAQETATVIEWLKQEGEQVEKGEPLLTVETDKVTIEIESPASGILAGVRVAPQQVVPVTEIIAYILQPEEELPEELPQVTEVPTPPPPQAPPTPPVAATFVAQRLAAAHGVDLSTVAGTGPGGRITKTDVELVLSEAEGAALAAPARPAAEPPSGKVRATPAARRVARERGVDISAVTGSGPRGRVQAADALALALTPGPSPEITARRDHPAARNATHYRRADDRQLSDNPSHHLHCARGHERVREDTGATQRPGRGYRAAPRLGHGAFRQGGGLGAQAPPLVEQHPSTALRAGPT